MIEQFHRAVIEQFHSATSGRYTLMSSSGSLPERDASHVGHMVGVPAAGSNQAARSCFGESSTKKADELKAYLFLSIGSLLAFVNTCITPIHPIHPLHLFEM